MKQFYISITLCTLWGVFLIGLSGCAQPVYTMDPVAAPALFPRWEDHYWQGGSAVGAYRTGGHPLTHLTADSALHAPMVPFREIE